jgi:hypothetical protein
MTGHLAYVLTTTPTILVPLSLIRMGIELKPYAMFLNFPSDCEADRYGALRDHGSLDLSLLEKNPTSRGMGNPSVLTQSGCQRRNARRCSTKARALAAQKAQMYDKSKQALRDLREGVEATRRMVLERCKVRERATVC